MSNKVALIPKGRKLVEFSLFYWIAYTFSVIIFTIVATILSLFNVSTLGTIVISLSVSSTVLLGAYYARWQSLVRSHLPTREVREKDSLGKFPIYVYVEAVGDLFIEGLLLAIWFLVTYGLTQLIKITAGNQWTEIESQITSAVLLIVAVVGSLEFITTVSLRIYDRLRKDRERDKQNKIVISKIRRLVTLSAVSLLGLAVYFVGLQVGLPIGPLTLSVSLICLLLYAMGVALEQRVF